MKAAKTIHLDPTRLYGFKIVPRTTTDGAGLHEQTVTPGSTIGAKVGAKANARADARADSRIGAKIGVKG